MDGWVLYDTWDEVTLPKVYATYQSAKRAQGQMNRKHDTQLRYMIFLA